VALDASFVGRAFPASGPYHVTREKVREFADAIGATDHPDEVAPPTFPIVITLPAGRVIIDDLGIEYSRVVHGDQRFAYTRPVVAGDVLSCVCTVEEMMARGGNDFVTTRADLTDAHGAPVVSVWTRLVVRGAP
jgi:acyl dehydratase